MGRGIACAQNCSMYESKNRQSRAGEHRGIGNGCARAGDWITWRVYMRATNDVPLEVSTRTGWRELARGGMTVDGPLK